MGGGGGFIRLMLDGEGSQTNQSLRILVKALRTILGIRHDSSRTLRSLAELTQTRWTIKTWETSRGGYKKVTQEGLPPSFSATCKSQQNALQSPSFTAPTTGCISLLLNPLGHAEREREREALGLVLQKSIPQREETLSITTFSLFQTLSVIFMTPAIHLVLESKRTGGERGLPRTSYGC